MEEQIRKSVVELSELRIGNILRYKGKLVHVTTLSMDIDDEYQETIGFCELGKITDEEADWNRALFADLERIDLTEDVLAACGFDSDEESRLNQYLLFPHFDGNPQTELRLNISARMKACALKEVTQTTLEIINRDAVDMTLHGISLRYPMYLHSLQNLYHSLSGGELKYVPNG